MVVSMAKHNAGAALRGRPTSVVSDTCDIKTSSGRLDKMFANR